MQLHRIVCALLLAVVVGLVGSLAGADGKAKKKDNCLVVVITNWTNVSEVFVEYWDPTGNGQWVTVKKKFIRKNDKGKTESCGLKPGAKYQVKVTSQGNDSGWSPLTFQADPETGTHTVKLTLQPIRK